MGEPKPIYDDRWFWLTLRSLFLGIAKAIELRYDLGEKDKADRVA